MTVCRARAFSATRRLAGVGALLWVGAAAAAAQDAGTPVQLVPPGTDTGEESRPAERASPGGVTIGRIAPLSSDAAGAVGSGVFGADLWQGSSDIRLSDLMDRLPLPARSPVMQSLMRRLLASAAAPAPGELAEGDFVARRLALLLQLGAFEEAGQIAELAGEPAGSWSQAEALLWRGELERACHIVGTALTSQPSRQWRRVLVLCQAHQGNVAAAELTLTLLYDDPAGVDDSYLPIASHLLGHIEVEAAVLDDAVSFAASLAGSAPLDSGAISGLGPAAARALALYTNAPEDVRVAAAERAAALGSLSPEELGEVWRLPAFTEDTLRSVDPANPARGEAELAGPMARALLYQGAGFAEDNALRTELLQALWSSAPDAPGLSAFAGASLVSALTLTPDGSSPSFAALAIRALAATGRGDAAATWYRALAGSQETDGTGALWHGLPVIAVFGADNGVMWNTDTAIQWWNGAPSDVSPEAHAIRADRVFMVLDALGHNPGEAAWALFFDGPRDIEATMPHIGLRYALRDAVRGRRTGEALLLALIVLGEEGPAGASAIAVGSVIRALRAIGLPEDARAIAVEALAGDHW